MINMNWKQKMENLKVWQITKFGFFLIIILISSVLITMLELVLSALEKKEISTQPITPKETYKEKKYPKDSLLAELYAITEAIHEEIEDDFGNDNIRNLSPQLTHKIQILSKEFKPYRYVVNGALIEKPLSHERGLLLTTLLDAGLDSSTYHSLFENASFAYADLGGMNLEEAYLPQVKLGRANLKGTNLAHANLRDVTLYKANLDSVNLTGASLVGANLEKSSFVGTNLTRTNLERVNLKSANLEQTILKNTNFSDANLYHANLTSVDLTKANITGTNLKSANLTKANLRGMNLEKINLCYANLDKANLAGANLFGSHMINVFLRETNLEKANLMGADLRWSKVTDRDVFDKITSIEDFNFRYSIDTTEYFLKSKNSPYYSIVENKDK